MLEARGVWSGHLLPRLQTRRAAAKIKDGDVDDGRLVLAEVLATDPEYERAWLWFASVARDDAERRFCFEQAAAANPESKAKQELVKLRGVTAREPPEVVDLVAPPPPSLSTPSTPRLAPTRLLEGASEATTSSVLVPWSLAWVVVLGAVLNTIAPHGQEPIYVAVVGAARLGLTLEPPEKSFAAHNSISIASMLMVASTATLSNSSFLMTRAIRPWPGRLPSRS